jgi:FG-GAP repeat protein
MFGQHRIWFHKAASVGLLMTSLSSIAVAQVQISGSATHYRSLDANLNIGNERLDILGIATDPHDGVTYFVAQSNTTSNCPTSDRLRVYAHNTASNEWEYEGSIDHGPAVNIGCFAINGDTIAIGRTMGTFGVEGVNVYRRASNGTWTEEADLFPSDSFPGNQFGISVSLDGDRLAVGAARDDPDDLIHAWEGQGSVYIYDRVGSTWSLIQKVFVNDGEQGDDFGASVSIRSTINGWNMVVGAPDHSTDPGGINFAGAVYAFQNNGSGWNQTDKAVTTTDSFISGRFGDLGIGFDGAIVAAVDATDLHLYEMTMQGQLAPIDVIQSSGFLSDPVVVDRQVVIGDPEGVINTSIGPNVTMLSVDLGLNVTTVTHAAPMNFIASDRFGTSVVFNGGVFLAGAPDYDASGTNSGAIWSQTVVGNTYPTGLVIEGLAQSLSGFGQSVDSTNEWAVIGIPNTVNPCVPGTTGSIRIMRNTGGEWAHHRTIDAPSVDISHGFGHAVAIDGNWIAVSMPDYHRIGTRDYFGGIAMYEHDGTSWRIRHIVEGAATDEGFGDAIALSGEHLAVWSSNSSGIEKVTMFKLGASNRFHFVNEILSNGVTASAGFGSVLSLHHDTLLIGAPLNAGSEGYVTCKVFNRLSGLWEDGPEIQSPQLFPDSRFGAAISQTDDTVLLGLPGASSGEGQVAVYAKSPQSFGSPVIVNRPSMIATSGFGSSVTISENQVLIGHDDSNAIEAQFMSLDGSGLQHIQSILIPSRDPSAGFGVSVAIGAQTLFVGAPMDSISPNGREGMVHLYETDIRFTVPECDMDMMADRIQWIEDDAPMDSEYFAYSLEVDQGYAIAGSPYERHSFQYDGNTINANNAGKVTIYERTGLRKWSPVAIFRGGHSDNPEYSNRHADWLGESVDIEGSTAVAGARQATDESNGHFVSGSVRIYERGATGWGLSEELFPEENGQTPFVPIRNYGSAVDLDSTATLLAVGARNSAINGNGTGAGFVYERSGSSWIRSGALTAPVPVVGAHLGDSITVEEGWAAIGAKDDNTAGSGSGAVHIYSRQSLGSWSYHSSLYSPIMSTSIRFGTSIELSRSDLGLTLLVSSPGESDAGWPSHGRVYVYVLDELNSQWNLAQGILPEILSSSIAYGTDLSIDHNSLAIGAPYLHEPGGPPSRWTGGVELFNLSSSNGQFERRTTIRPQQIHWGSNNRWGSSVGLSGGTVFMGTAFADGEMYDPSNANLNYGALVAHDIVCVPDCAADLNGDGALNFLDVSAFLSAFSSQDPLADYNGDGMYNFLDVSEFLSDYSAGC